MLTSKIWFSVNFERNKTAFFTKSKYMQKKDESYADFKGIVRKKGSEFSKIYTLQG